jgi:hypothetical protein
MLKDVKQELIKHLLLIEPNAMPIAGKSSFMDSITFSNNTKFGYILWYDKLLPDSHIPTTGCITMKNVEEYKNAKTRT